MELPDVSRPFRFLIPLILVVSFAFQGCSTVFRNSVPERDGEVKGEVSSPVHVYRDRWGVPHIVAETLDDLLYAQGFVHAQERLFQMETERRLASGRLSEVYGKDALPLDRFFRSLSLKEKAGEMYRNLSEEDRRLIDRYVAGVNRAIETMKKPPPEMRLLSVEPEPFKGSDVALTALLKGFGLAQWLEELAYRVVLERAGEEKLKDILPFREDLYGISVIRHGNREFLNLEEADRLLTALLSFPLFPRTGGSNSWVVSGRKTADGLPRLFNDPHLPLTAPSVWFENHLIAKGFEVYGFSFPGAPFVVIGFNRHVAWGFTNVMMDDADLFVEEEGEKGGYLYRGRERKWEERRETISIRGENPEEIVVRKSVHGPLIPSLFPGLRESFAFRWTGYDALPGHLTALMWLNKARSAEDVVSALSRFSFPAQNVVFATSSGDIGYVLAGRIPKRKKVHPPLPVPGSSGEFDWEGYVDFRKNPKKLNPPEGFIATANFPPLPPGESPYISSVYEPPARGRRILKVLKGKDVFSLDELLALQTDVKLEPAEREKSLFVKILGGVSGLSEKERKALDLLASWDGSLNRNSAGGALFEVLYEEVLKNTFADELGNEGYRIFSRTLRVPILSLTKLLFEKPDSSWFDDVTTEKRETLEDVILKSFRDALKYLSERLGGEAEKWRWGKLHQVEIRHPFGKKWYLRRFFSIGPEEAPGSGRTVWKMEFSHGGDFTAIVGPSLRLAVSPVQPEDARVVITTGQSGLFFEDGYDDQFPLWLDGKYRSVLLSERDFKGRARHHLVLVPTGKKIPSD